MGRPKRLYPLGRYRLRVPKDAGTDKTYPAVLVVEYDLLADNPPRAELFAGLLVWSYNNHFANK